ncbi:MAG: response regulator [Nitrospira sp.]|nr:response regulator [Nitrospira sp.]
MKHEILVVEDEQDTADLLKRVLEREGFSVLQAKDGRQASTLVGTVRPPSLILLDLVIPYVSGPELLKLFRHHPDWKDIPVIVVSADHYEPDIQRALREGATAYVTKQKGSAGLLQAVKRLLAAAPAQDQIVADVASAAPQTRRVSMRRRLQSSQKKKRAA